jgi:hypothetical protein
MPKLAYISACEKVITDAETRAVSAIALFTKLTVNLTEAPPINAVAPKEWSILAAWDPDDGDERKEFVQYIQMLFPDGQPFAESVRLPFKMESNQRHHNTVKLLGFPVGQQGRCEVRVWVELDGKMCSEKASIYLLVEHQRSAVPTSSPTGSV